MELLPKSLAADPFWHALNTRHSHLALIDGDARKYPVDIAPFAALAKPTELALWELHGLLAPGESTWLAGAHYPHLPELQNEGSLECLQMVLTRPVDRAATDLSIEKLGPTDSDVMVELTDIAFPGFFRSRTYEMGSYYGVRDGSSAENGPLIAMSGERLALEGYTEISAVCTLPAHRGRGLAQKLIARVAHDHAEQGLTSFLHVASTNTGAIELYHRLGFEDAGRIMLTRVSRAPAGVAGV